ncbi:MAG: AsmA-like C-terminal region-containing protein [Bacteroidia bacterium]
MKRFFAILGIIIFLLLALLIAIPFVFKDKIKEATRQELSNIVQADVDFKDVGINLFKSFPQASIGIEGFSIINRAPFEGDTLVAAKSLELAVEFMSLFKEDFKVSSISLKEGLVNIQVNKKGEANYDIYESSPEAVPVDSTLSTNWSVSIQKYSISDTDIRYQDETQNLDLAIKGLNHEGSGDLSAENFLFDTKTSIDDLKMVYDGIAYLKNSTATLDAKLAVEKEPDGYFINLKENRLVLNELALHADGTIDLQPEGYMMDLKWNAPDATFKKLMSMVPAVYKQDFSAMKLEGDAALKGYVQGRYDDKHLPGIGLTANIKNGFLKYPDLPQSISNINIDFEMEEPDGSFTRTKINIPTFHAEMGPTPIDGALASTGTGPIDLEGRLKTKLDLGSLGNVIPLGDTELKGLLDIDATAKGRYDEAKGTFPLADASLNFLNGYIHHKDYPAELKDINVQARIAGNNDLKKALLDVPSFHFLLDEEAIDGTLRVRDFDDPAYELTANGTLDLDKLMQVFPQEDMDVGGRVVVNSLVTKGRYSDIEAERYTALPTSGSGRLERLRYNSSYMAEPLLVEEAKFSFGPQNLTITNANGKLGESDFAASGNLNNYLAYALMDNQSLKGNFTASSSFFDVNPWLAEEEGTVTTGAPAEEAFEAYPIPPGVDINIDASIQKLKYLDLNLKKVKGMLTIKDEAAKLNDGTFEVLGARTSLSGSYSTPDGTAEPIYTLIANMDGLAPSKAYEAFSTVRSFAPIAKLIQGIANLKFALSGKLGRDLYPLMETISSEGFFEVVEGESKGPAFLQKASKLTGIGALDHLDLSGAKGWFTIEDGKIFIEPMDLQAGNVKLNLSGSQSITGALALDLNVDAPSGSLGQAATSKLSSLTGGAVQTSDRVQLGFDVSGTAINPILKPRTSTIGNTVKDAIVEVAEDKVKAAVKEKTGLDLGDNSVKEAAKAAEQQVRDSLTAVAAAAKQRAKDSVDAVIAREKAKADAKIKKELEDQLGKENAEKLNDLKKLLPFGKKKKKNQ